MPKSNKKRQKGLRERAAINNGARGSHPNDYLAHHWDMRAGSSIKELARRTAGDAMYLEAIFKWCLPCAEPYAGRSIWHNHTMSPTRLFDMHTRLLHTEMPVEKSILFEMDRKKNANWEPVSVQENTIILEIGRSRGRVLVSRAIAESEFIRRAMRWRSTSKTDEAIKVFKDVIAKPTSDLIMQYLQFDMTCGTLMWLWVDTFAAQGLKDAADILIMPRLLSVLRGRYPYALDDTNSEEDGRRMPEVDSETSP